MKQAMLHKKYHLREKEIFNDAAFYCQSFGDFLKMIDCED